MNRARMVRGVAVVAVWALSACSDGPSGPGTVTLTVEASVPLGAAVIELRGAGVESVTPGPAGWARLETLPTQGSTPVARLVIVQRQPGTLSVEIRVQDVGGDLPSLTVLEASDVNDLPLPSLGGVKARFAG